MPNTDRLEAQVTEEYLVRGIPEPPAGRFILILGSSSAGKTSTIQNALKSRPELRLNYDAALLTTDRFALYTRNLFERADASYFFPYEVEAALIRFLQNFSADANCLCDQGLYSIWAYSRAIHQRGGLDDHQYQTFYALILTLGSLAPTPRVVVRFRCDAAEARRRVEQRGRRHEIVALSESFIADLDKAYSHVMAAFPGYVVQYFLDTTYLPPEIVTERFLTILDAHPA